MKNFRTVDIVVLIAVIFLGINTFFTKTSIPISVAQTVQFSHEFKVNFTPIVMHNVPGVITVVNEDSVASTHQLISSGGYIDTIDVSYNINKNIFDLKIGLEPRIFKVDTLITVKLDTVVQVGKKIDWNWVTAGTVAGVVGGVLLMRSLK